MALGKRRKTGRVTLAQVAEYIGVTSMTVSRALRTPEAVSAEVRDKVDSAVKELGYMPNKMAGSLASASSKIIVVVLPSVISLPWQKGMSKLQQFFRDKGYTVFFNSVTAGDNTQEVIQQALQLSPAALVAGSLVIPAECRNVLEKNTIPFLEIVDIEAEDGVSRVGVNNRRAAFELTNHLISKGLQKIGFMGCQNKMVAVQQRLKGWREAMIEHYLVPEILVTHSAGPDLAMGAKLFRRMRDNWSEIDAVICTDSTLASGVLFECQRQLLKVPRHISLATFDEQQSCEFMHPGITSIHYSITEVIEQACGRLEYLLTHPEQPLMIEINSTLNIRDSV